MKTVREENYYEVIVVGAGHAGCEAALAAARLGCPTLLVTLSLDQVALMACNPSIGGPAKGHLVREIDALGGEMGLNADRNILQLRLLNTKKGPAVRALRAQINKKAYQQAMKLALEQQPRLTLREAMVGELLVEGGRVAGVKTLTGGYYRSRAVILTTGVYLRSSIFVGHHTYPGAPAGQMPSVSLAENLVSLGFRLERLKTGTPPRVYRETIDLDSLEPVPGEQGTGSFSFLTPPRQERQFNCWMTYTNPETHRLIRENIEKAALYAGLIKGIGPRYCPSIEDKVVRFAGKDRHPLFIEPEGDDTTEMYIQGISTSLPEEVQLKVLRTVRGLEKAEITRAAYAIEYDFAPPSQLGPSLETRRLPGLFLAGQVNGTTGYEEAAAQGLVAGINAACYCQGKGPLVLERSQGYLGVLVDDLVTKEIVEPYRLFTSRAEYRLLLRMDNADLRLTETGYRLGLVTGERYARYQEKKEALEKGKESLRQLKINPDGETSGRFISLGLSPPSRPVTGEELLRRPEVKYQALRELFPDKTGDLPPATAGELENQVKYWGYIEKEKTRARKLEHLEKNKVPPGFDYEKIMNLSTEARQKLTRLQPLNLGQASRIDGVSPSDISILQVALEKHRREKEEKKKEQQGHRSPG